MIQFAERATVEFATLHQSIGDLAESIAFVASVAVTKEEFREELAEGIDSVKKELRQEIGASEHRIKSYIDDKVVAQNVMPVIQKEDKKMNAVIDSLEDAAVFSGSEALRLKQLGAFPHLA